MHIRRLNGECFAPTRYRDHEGLAQGCCRHTRWDTPPGAVAIDNGLDTGYTAVNRETRKAEKGKSRRRSGGSEGGGRGKPRPCAGAEWALELPGERLGRAAG